MTKVAVVIGGYLGDEGKGKVTNYYLNKYGAWGREVLCIRSTGGPNTGATVYRGDRKIQVHQTPIGIFMQGRKHGYIGNGVYVNLDILRRELELMQELMDYENGAPLRTLYISRGAHIITDEHLALDEEKEKKLGYGSTKNGVSIAARFKYDYMGMTFGQMYDKSPDVRDWLADFNVQVVDPYEFFEDDVLYKMDIVIEGTQGVGLDVNHGFDYPYVSAGSFSTFGLLDGVGYSLAPTEVVMCLKTYGSYFGPERMGIADFDNNDFREFAGEFGTTTKRPRKLCWLDTGRLRRNAQLIQPTVVALNHLDTLSWFTDHQQEWKLVIDGNGFHTTMGFNDHAVVDEKITSQGHLFLDTIRESTGCNRLLLGTGPTIDQMWDAD